MIVKIMPIRSDYSGREEANGGTEGMKNAYEYITNPEKVIVARDDVPDYEMVAKELLEVEANDGDIGNNARVLRYMENDEKIKGKYISGYLCHPDTALEEFESAKMETLRLMNKDKTKCSGAMGFHIIQSFPEGLTISDEEVHQCGIELCEKLHAHQAVICSHVHPVLDEDGEIHGDKKHNHILINAYIHPDRLDPKHPEVAKYHDCIETYSQLRAWNDQIAIDHGFPIVLDPEKDRTFTWYESDAVNKGYSWKNRVRYDIENVRRLSSNWEEFVEQMEATGYQIRDGKDIRYTAPNGKKIRGSKLGKQYTKDSLQRYWTVRSTTVDAINQDAENNASPPLLDVVLDRAESLRAAIPLGLKRQGPGTYYYLPLENRNEPSETLETYFIENKSYDICDEHNHVLYVATGKEILDCMEALRFGKQQYLDARNRSDGVEKIYKRREKKEKEGEFYENLRLLNSKTKKPYRVTSLYDKNGRRRSMLELIFILASIIIKNESGKWDLDRIPDERLDDAIYAPTSWKIQMMMDSITMAREEELETPEKLQRRIHEVGASISRTKSGLKKVTKTKESMETLHDSIREYRKVATVVEEINAMPDGPEKEDAIAEYRDYFERYKEAKATLYGYNVKREEDIQDFEKRYKQISKDVKELESRLEDSSDEYRKLKKLNYNLELAQSTQYCYGPAYVEDKEVSTEQEIGREKENDEERKNKDLEIPNSENELRSEYDDGKQNWGSGTIGKMNK